MAKRLSEYFRKYCCLRPVHCDLTDQERKLQEAFHAKNLYFRFDRLKKCYQVWEDADGLWCVMSLDTPNVHRAIHALKRRQKSRQQMKELYNQHIKQQREDYKYKRDSLASEAASEVVKAKRGTVISSGRRFTKTEL